MFTYTLTNQIRRYVIEELKTFWQKRPELVLKLPIPYLSHKIIEITPPLMSSVKLPFWAHEFGVNGKILVPFHYILNKEEPVWQNVDWLGVIFWYLNGIAEQSFEKKHGPIHSYSFKLRGWDKNLWQYAWVNRIALFLRKWVALKLGIKEDILFGSIPRPEIIITHDIDAIEKNPLIRLKQTLFLLFGAFKKLSKGRALSSLKLFKKAFVFFFSKGNYWNFDYLINLERINNINSYYFVYAKPKSHRKMKLLLFDPLYDINNSRKLKLLLQKLIQEGYTIGLHQSFETWKDPEKMISERRCLEEALKISIHACRQHWLRFSWKYTWKSQQEAGLSLDMTLGFNDRPGFRNGSAVKFHPWNFETDSPMKLEVLPIILMDSHFYNYQNLEDIEIFNQIKYWIYEVYKFYGKASILWHVHVLSKDFNWRNGFEKLITIISNMNYEN